MRIFRLLAEAKVGAVTEWLDASLLSEGADPSRKSLIFAHHHSVHSGIADFLRKKLAADEWIHITGTTPQAERMQQLSRFQQQPKCRFAVLALTACGVGLNLACADTAVFAELCWNPSTLEQAEARIHRMGQKASHVSIYYLTAGEGEKSPDSAMFGALVKKSRAAARVVDGGAAPRNDLGAVGVPPRRAEQAVEQDAQDAQDEGAAGGEAGGEAGGAAGGAAGDDGTERGWEAPCA